MFNSNSKLPFIVAVVAIVFDFQETTANFQENPKVYPASVPEEGQVHALIDHPVVISCSTSLDDPLNKCRWERKASRTFGKRYLIHITPGEGNTTEIIVDGPNDANHNYSYEFTGAGLLHGDCSVIIRNVTEFHIAEWSCILTNTKNDSWIGALNITEMAIPKPYFQGNFSDGFVFNQTLPNSSNVTCCITDDKLVNVSRLDIYLHANKSSKENFKASNYGDMLRIRPRPSTLCRQKTFTFLPNHNNGVLICTATYIHQEEEYNTSISERINVKFGPDAKTAKIVQKLIGSNILQTNVTFSANPEPCMKWALIRDNNKTFQVPVSGNHSNKYKTRLIDNINSVDEYTATLEILNVQEEDYRHEFILNLTNKYGSKEISVRLTDAQSGQDIYWIIISIAAGLAVLSAFVVTAICIVTKQQEKKRGEYSPAKVQYSTQTPEEEQS